MARRDLPEALAVLAGLLALGCWVAAEAVGRGTLAACLGAAALVSFVAAVFALCLAGGGD